LDKLLQVRDLRVHFKTYGGEVQAVRGVSFDVHRGECVAIVGESGSGKTVTASALMRLIPMPPGKIAAGSILFNGVELTTLDEHAMQKIRGREIGMIFQDPMTSLNPTMTIGRQIMEGLIKHHRLIPADARREAAKMLELVGIPNPGERLDAYPHQFSGGMRQRVMIAIALSCKPKLLIADEPTTALDVTIQAQILDVLKDLRRRLNTSIILITHDLGVVAALANRVVVMYAGQVVEQGTVEDVFYNPQHPYTWSLLKAMPRLDASQQEPLLSIPGSPPDLFAPPPGCAFAPRCPHAMRVCHNLAPEQTHLSALHTTQCWLQHAYASGTPGVPRREERGASR